MQKIKKILINRALFGIFFKILIYIYIVLQLFFSQAQKASLTIEEIATNQLKKVSKDIVF